jgi:hypothetical protein
MRRLALAATIPLFIAGPALAQSQVQHGLRAAPETATADGPVPSAADPTHPSTQNPAAPLQVSPPEQDPVLPVRPAAPDRDQLSGHLRIGASFAYGTFSGSYFSSSPIGAKLGGSAFVNADLGYGLSRQFEVVVIGDYSGTFSGSGCASCEAKSWAVGPMLRYHLVEGTRFNPWIGLGVALRHISLVGYEAVRSVKSVEFLRIAIGGNWFATPQLTFGPILGCALASSYAAPSGDHSEIFALFYAGIRVAWDAPGR